MRQRLALGGFVLMSAILTGMSPGWASDGTANDSDAAAQQCDATPMLMAEATGGTPAVPDAGPSTGDVQERAVPRMSPGGPGMSQVLPRREFEQAIVEGSRITAKPGYSIQVLPNGEGILTRRANDPTGTSVKCVCTGAKSSGRCKLVTTGTSSGNCVSDTCKNGFCGVSLGTTAGVLQIQ